MGHFRKKPIDIEAVQFIGLVPHEAGGMFAQFSEQTLWLQAALELGGKARELGQVDKGAVFMFGGSLAVVEINGGTIMLEPNDWIVRGTSGELYPCKPHIFSAIYEEIEA